MRPGPVLVVRDLVDNEKEVAKIAACAELCVRGVRECVRDEKLGTAPEKECELGSREELVAEDPLRGLCTSLLVVSAEGRGPWADGVEIGEAVSPCNGRHGELIVAVG